MHGENIKTYLVPDNWKLNIHMTNKVTVIVLYQALRRRGHIL